MTPTQINLQAGAPLRADILGPAKNTRDPRTAAQAFAGLFYSMVMKEMQKTVPENPFTGGRGQGMFQAIWANEMGLRLAGQRNDALVEALMKNFEKQSYGESAGLQGDIV